MFNPMLAHNYLEHKHKIRFPVATQPKLNGVRMIWHDGTVYSRSGKPLMIPNQLSKQLQELKHLSLDGELYLHGHHLDHIRGNAKRLVSLVQDLDLQFHVYDIFVDNEIYTPFKERMEMLREIPESSHIKLVPTVLAKNDPDIRYLMQEHLNKGYEGVIIRDLDAAYQQKRTNVLLKLKPWFHTLAVVIGFVEGKGKYQGMLGALRIRHGPIRPTKTRSWVCNVGGGFTDLQRKEIWENRHKYDGRKICLKYLELTSLGNPHSPIFKGFVGDKQ